MTPTTPTLHTPRLLLQPLTLDDAAPIQQIFPQWEIVRFLAVAVPWPYPADGALCFLRDLALPAIARGEAWHWTLRLRDKPARLIGALSLHRGEANRGFWIDPRFGGRGLMTEAVAATNTWWFGPFGATRLRSSRAAANQASRRIAEKTGMRLIDQTEMHCVSGPQPCETWEGTATEWHAHPLAAQGAP